MRQEHKTRCKIKERCGGVFGDPPLTGSDRQMTGIMSKRPEISCLSVGFCLNRFLPKSTTLILTLYVSHMTVLGTVNMIDKNEVKGVES